MQSKRRSIAESLTNIAVGMIVAIASQYLIFPCFGIEITFGEHMWITVWFTAISIIRSYLLRRYFNKGD